MKKFLFSLLAFCSLIFSYRVDGQSFTVVSDTVYATVHGVASVTDNIINTSGGGFTVRWHSSASDFPSDWLTPGAFGICDNLLCRYNSNDMQLWNDTFHTGTTFTSGNMPAGDTASFYLALDLSNASLGTHYMTVNIANVSNSKNVTFVINKQPTAVPSISTQVNEVNLYPNPATNEINLVYDANADVKNVAVYNIIGKVMSVFKVSGSSANLNVDNIPSGIYFVRLYSSDGHVVAIKKFTKQ